VDDVALPVKDEDHLHFLARYCHDARIARRVLARKRVVPLHDRIGSIGRVPVRRDLVLHVPEVLEILELDGVEAEPAVVRVEKGVLPGHVVLVRDLDLVEKPFVAGRAPDADGMLDGHLHLRIVGHEHPLPGAPGRGRPPALPLPAVSLESAEIERIVQPAAARFLRNVALRGRVLFRKERLRGDDPAVVLVDIDYDVPAHAGLPDRVIHERGGAQHVSYRRNDGSDPDDQVQEKRYEDGEDDL